MFDKTCMQGRKVLITAGASGLGLEMARLFSSTGAQVFICDVDEKALEKAHAEIPGIWTMVADVADEASVARLFDQVTAQMGGLDVLINNAGIAGPTGFVETLSKKDWDRTLAVNITGQFLCVRLAVPLLKASAAGVIINLSSAAGHLGFAGRAPYSASKWAVVGFTKTLAIELGKSGIRVNAILPGAVDGDRIRAVIKAKAETFGVPVDQMTSTYTNLASLGRMVTARDIANMALFVASDAAVNITGQALAVDGHTQALT
ncbi:SDR family oxidoreductase [Castellaniella sp.]|uniref:SDR family oxidoreductase n=1 Tax=Castellaniella sp. TaxID=1955812 RepID=UPI003560CBC0